MPKNTFLLKHSSSNNGQPVVRSYTLTDIVFLLEGIKGGPWLEMKVKVKKNARGIDRKTGRILRSDFDKAFPGFIFAYNLALQKKNDSSSSLTDVTSWWLLNQDQIKLHANTAFVLGIPEPEASRYIAVSVGLLECETVPELKIALPILEQELS